MQSKEPEDRLESVACHEHSELLRGVVQKEPSVVSGLRRGLRGQVMVAAAQSHCGLQDINGILQHVAFCVWLLSLSMMFSGVFHDVT